MKGTTISHPFARRAGPRTRMCMLVSSARARVSEIFPARPLVYQRALPSTGRVQISMAALARMMRYTQTELTSKEAGGVLLGGHILGTQDIVIDTVTVPMPGDRRSRTRFFRAKKLHQLIIDMAHERSDGTCTYLGEWHTHPEEVPTPSMIDWLDWQRRLIFDIFTPPIFFCIVGTASIRVWEGKRGHKPVMLSLYRVDTDKNIDSDHGINIGKDKEYLA